MMNQPHADPVRCATFRPAEWLIGLALAAIALALWFRPGEIPGALLPAAFGQSQPLAGARGIFAFTGQLDANRYGLFMLDVDQGTLWCYDLDTAGGGRKIRLIAARTWVYDRYLQDYNNAKPDFRDVQQLVAQQRQAQLGRAADGGSSPLPATPPERARPLASDRPE